MDWQAGVDYRFPPSTVLRTEVSTYLSVTDEYDQSKLVPTGAIIFKHTSRICQNVVVWERDPR